MPGDGFEGFEAMIGAFSNIGKEDAGLTDARCPKCGASEFLKASDLYYEAARRAGDPDAPAPAAPPAGLTDDRILARFSPPRRRSALGRAVIVALPLAAVAYLVFWRFGEVPGEFALVAAIVITIIAFMTTTRRLSDEYYDRRDAWNRLYVCRQCGQLVAG